MATRVLPGAYLSLNDLSQFPEGVRSLVVGYVVKADRGPVGEPTLVVSPADFLSRFTLTGKPTVKDDPTMWSILKVLQYTNQMYVIRAVDTETVKYGGILLKKAITFGKLTKAVSSTKKLTIEGTDVIAPSAGTVLMITGTESETVKDGINGYYTVEEVEYQEGVKAVVTVKEAIERDFDGEGLVRQAPVVPLADPIANPDGYDAFGADDLALITGIDPGEYNGKLAYEIVSAVDTPDELVYHKGADIGGEPCTFDTMRLIVRETVTGSVLETFTFARAEGAKEIDGTVLGVDYVVNGASSYIKVINNKAVEGMPFSTINFNTPGRSGAVVSGKGDAGAAVTANTLAGAAEPFYSKIVPISILGNGCSPEAEDPIFQQKLLDIANKRQDCFVVLNDPVKAERANNGTKRAQDIVKYKKEDLGSTSFYAAMYAPHVNEADSFNNRTVKIGAEATAIAGWLNVVSTIGYPYAYAGPKNGLVTGVTCDWKIGDEGGEAQLLNDASVNYVAYDGKVGRYYMQCQNTLQVANSSLRNIGCLLNILDIKETIGTDLKEYINLPITADLRNDILMTVNAYLAPMAGRRYYFCNFQDITTDADIAQDTLRFLLTISLTRYAQKIYCAINIVNNTYSFSILQSV